MKTTLVIGLALVLCACGGGSLTAEEIAQHDADLAALKGMTTQPVSPSASAAKS